MYSLSDLLQHVSCHLKVIIYYYPIEIVSILILYHEALLYQVLEISFLYKTTLMYQ